MYSPPRTPTEANPEQETIQQDGAVGGAVM
jgi:hypothetical protein